MKKIYSLIVFMFCCLILTGCESNEDKCAKAFDCTKIEDNSYRCNYCSDGSKNCSNPSGVTCNNVNE